MACVCVGRGGGLVAGSKTEQMCHTRVVFPPPSSKQICVLTSYIIFIPFNRFSGMHFHISVRYFVLLTTTIEQREYFLLEGGGGNTNFTRIKIDHKILGAR